jgi:O-antigen/teichoic acid export membrane protein
MQLSSIVSNVKWVLLTQGGVGVLTMARGIVLARLLNPVDFGIVGVAMMLHAMIKQFSDMGVGSAVVYFQKKSDEILPVAVVMKGMFGLVVAAIIVLLAPLWANFFDHSEVVFVTQFSALFVLTEVLSFPAQVQAQIRLRFKKMAKPAVAGTAIGCIVAIVLAFVGFGYWSIVWGVLAGRVTEMGLLMRAFPWRVRLAWDRNVANELWAYGLPIMAASGIHFITLQVDNIVVGKVLDLAALGYYLVAFRWANFGSYQLAAGIGSVLFPTFSHWRATEQDPIDQFEMVLRMSAVLYVPMAVGMILIAPEFVRVALGERWLPIIIPLQVLCVAGIFRSVGSTAGKLLLALGHPKVEVRVQFGFLVTLTVLLVPLTAWFGVVGASLSVLVAGIPWHLGVRVMALRRVTGIGFTTIGRAMLPSLTAAAVMVTIILLAKVLVASAAPTLGFLLFVVPLGAILYTVTIWVLLGKELTLVLRPASGANVS